MQSDFLAVAERGDRATLDVQTKAAGPSGSLPLTEEVTAPIPSEYGADRPIAGTAVACPSMDSV